MTEDEAKTKWCPFARVTIRDDIADSWNRFEDGIEAAVDGSHCIASNCMAWRWGKKPSADGVLFVEDREHGYCGLASRPG